ncbi:MAG TPA: imidazole glycerol phosphate synthase subunit HisH [Candidatus Acidoferrum sp.]|nr:imidazole glycerol phosphate synthase subunit HisH [Candidatus Acidoferrum sp.]
MNVTLLDYGAGNVTSVERALRRLGAQVFTTNRPEAIAESERLILPGVGHCGALIAALDVHNLRQPLREAIARGVNFLGICLGLQALYEASDEAPSLAGLGLLPGRVTHLPPGVKLPHMGWNQLQRTKTTSHLSNSSWEGTASAVPKSPANSGVLTPEARGMVTRSINETPSSRLLEGISPEAYFYFAHSYAAPAAGPECTAVCEHGRAFIAVIEQRNIFGVQFHPEKSGAPGAKLLENFLRLPA